MLHRGKQLYVFLFANKHFAVLMRIHHHRRGRIACISHIKQMAQRVYSNIEHPIYCNQFAVMCTIRKSFKIRFISCDYRMNILDFDLNVSMCTGSFVFYLLGMLISIFMLSAMTSVKYIV